MINCGHHPMLFIPGATRVMEPKQNEEQNEKQYAESQQQRALERKVRQEKLKLDTLKAQGASEDEIKAQKEKVKEAGNDVQRFCDETGRARRRNREYTPVQASFPEEGSYNPAEFPTEQRDMVNEFFRG